MSKSKKLIWILILQAWTMIWVIIGHAPLNEPVAGGIDQNMHQVAKALVNFAYSFHMPLFIMISGYLFYRTRIIKGWRYLDMLKEKWLRLGIPYIFFISIALILKFSFPDKMDRSIDISLCGLFSNYINPYNSALREMWFVAVIFLFFLLYPIYPSLLKNKNTTIVTISLAIPLYFIPIDAMPGILAFNRGVHNFIFFFIGLAISRWKLEDWINDWKLILFCICGYLICYLFSFPFLPALFASVGFWGIAMKADTALTSNIFSSFREYTYQIFLIGIFVQIFVKILARIFIFPGSYPIWWLICVLLGIYIPVLLSNIPGLKNQKIYKRILGL